MPKMKTKGSIKKRFRMTKNKKIVSTQANKRHNLRKLSGRSRRVQTGVSVLCKSAAKIVKKYMV